MTKYLLFLAVLFLLVTTRTRAQVTTFNYLSSGFSTSSCNLFSPATNVKGSDGNEYLHTSVYGAPVYNGGVMLYDWHSTAEGTQGNGDFGTAYAISYPFKPGFTYSIAVTIANAFAQGVDVPYGSPTTNTPGATNNFVLGISNTLPGTSSYQACTPLSQDPPTSSPFAAPIYSSGLQTSSTPSTVTVSNVSVAGNSQYLLVGSWPGPFVNGANYTTGNVTISGVTISATPQIQPGVTYICSSQVYSISVSPSATWTVSPASGVVSITPNGNSVTVTKTGSGNAVLTATLPNGVAGTIDITTVPSCNVTSSTNGACSGSYQTWYVDATPNCPNANNWSWTVDNPSRGTFDFGNPNAPNTYVDVSGGGGITVTFEDACGVRSTENGVTIYSECGTGEAEAAAFSVYPNPASGSTTITALTPAAAASKPGAIYAVRILDKTGNTRKTQQFSGGQKSAQVSLVGLSPDVYFISIFDGKKWTTQNIVIQ